MSTCANRNYQKIIQFLKEYERKECLWNPNNPHHRCRSVVHEAWVELSQFTDGDVPETKRKLRNLVNYFHRENKKYIKMEKSELTNRMPKWFAYKHLLFLKDKHKNVTTIPEDTKPECLEIPDEEDFANQSEDLLEENEKDELMQEDDSYSKMLPVLESAITKREQPTVPVEEKRSQTDDIISSVVHKTDPIKENNERTNNFKPTFDGSDRDENVVFCEYVWKKLKKLDYHSQVIAQHKINQVLFEADLGQYKNTRRM